MLYYNYSVDDAFFAGVLHSDNEYGRSLIRGTCYA